MSILQSIPFYEDLSDSAKETLKVNAQTLHIEEGEEVTSFGEGLCDDVFFVDEGRIRVFKTGENGEEVTLYDVVDQETCLANLRCIFDDKSYEVRAVAKEDSTIVSVPSATVKNTLIQEPAFVEYTMQTTLEKIDTLMWHYETISFAPVKNRIILYLHEQSKHQKITTIYTTHREIASEIGATREVVSRNLKELEKERYIRLHRGRIKILKDLPAL